MATFTFLKNCQNNFTEFPANIEYINGIFQPNLNGNRKKYKISQLTKNRHKYTTIPDKINLNLFPNIWKHSNNNGT